MGTVEPGQLKSVQCLVDVEQLYADGVTRALSYLNDGCPLKSKMAKGVLMNTVAAVTDRMRERVSDANPNCS